MSIPQDAARLANETLESSWNNALPVDPIAIARDLGVEVYSAFIGDDVAGMLRKEPYGTPEIYLNATDPWVRRRFSCAHELGHYIKNVETASGEGEMAFIDYRDARSRNGTDADERFANAFAANLLMPESLVKSALEAGRTTLGMANDFDVSLDAMTYRLKNLHLPTP